MFFIRPAQGKDVTRMTEIYNESVLEGKSNYVSFSETENQREKWLSDLNQKGLPVQVVVQEQNDEVIGFSGLTPFHPADGYRFTVTGSIYISKIWRAKGVGHLLAKSMIDSARACGFHTILAGIRSTNFESLSFHKGLGFKEVGFFPQIAQMNGVWYDDVCLMLHL